jgi:murein DD-endopeptidase MepM/ murein hydrolase activator NlpD
VNSAFKITLLIMAAPLLCGAALMVGYVVLIALSIPQLPAWAQQGVTRWLLDIPQHSETSDNGSSPAGSSVVPWEDYSDPNSDLYGLPMRGPVQLWSDWYDKPLLGCVFHDPFYTTHTGDDFPVNAGTPIHTTLGGKVVWAGYNGPWGNLVVVENSSYQVWLAHLDAVGVSPGQILGYSDIVGFSGNTGNSTGAHLHYGIKHKTGEDSYVWLDPHQFFTTDEYIYIGCSD